MEIEKQLRKEEQKKNGPFVPVVNTNRDTNRDKRPGTKEHPFLFRPGIPGWETGTTEVSQPGQISVSVVVCLQKKY